MELGTGKVIPVLN